MFQNLIRTEYYESVINVLCATQIGGDWQQFNNFSFYFQTEFPCCLSDPQLSSAELFPPHNIFLDVSRRWVRDWDHQLNYHSLTPLRVFRFISVSPSAGPSVTGHGEKKQLRKQNTINLLPRSGIFISSLLAGVSCHPSLLLFLLCIARHWLNKLFTGNFTSNDVYDY